MAIGYGPRKQLRGLEKDREIYYVPVGGIDLIMFGGGERKARST